MSKSPGAASDPLTREIAGAMDDMVRGADLILQARNRFSRAVAGPNLFRGDPPAEREDDPEEGGADAN
jgi:hypothetical protein